MRLDEATCRERLRTADHGILATLHPERGIDAVPACFVVLGATVCVPVDEVKPKASTRLQRAANLDHDPRATLLVEHWDAQRWDRLWWVRAHLRATEPTAALVDEATAALRDRYEQYRDTTFADVLTFEVVGLAGWAARA